MLSCDMFRETGDGCSKNTRRLARHFPATTRLMNVDTVSMLTIHNPLYPIHIPSRLSSIMELEPKTFGTYRFLSPLELSDYYVSITFPARC